MPPWPSHLQNAVVDQLANGPKYLIRHPVAVKLGARRSVCRNSQLLGIGRKHFQSLPASANFAPAGYCPVWLCLADSSGEP